MIPAISLPLQAVLFGPYPASPAPKTTFGTEFDQACARDIPPQPEPPFNLAPSPDSVAALVAPHFSKEDLESEDLCDPEDNMLPDAIILPLQPPVITPLPQPITTPQPDRNCIPAQQERSPTLLEAEADKPIALQPMPDALPAPVRRKITPALGEEFSGQNVVLDIMRSVTVTDTVPAPPVQTIQISTPTAASGPTALDPQRFIERHLDLARDTVWLNDLARDIVAAGKGSDRLSFRLMPQHLGRLDVDLTTTRGAVSVSMSASSNEAVRIVAAAQPRLIEELRVQGVRVASTDVTGGNTQSQSEHHHQHAHQHQRPEPKPAFVKPSIRQEQTPKSMRPVGRFA
jgi:flagellar hook-length control protein FliK